MPVKPDQSSRQDPPERRRSQSSKQQLARLAGRPALIAATLAALITGIAIGNAARKRIDRWAHAYF
jgi:hypothetical protein